jgi:protein involved in polysaccharide export with SLBB domain
VQLGDADADAVNVRVGEDGTVELPKLGRVKAEGQTSEALREEIAAKLKSAANQSEPSKVTVKRLGTAEAGQKPQPEAGAPTPTDVAPPAPDKPQ